MLLEWQVVQWRSFADRLGFRAELQPAIEAAIKTKGQFGSIMSVGVSLVANWVDSRSAPVRPSGYPAEKTADLIADTIAAWRGEPLSLWRVEKEAGSLAGNGCVAGHRAFPTGNAVTYFRPALSSDPTPRESCTYNTPIVVFLGTWPWYYGGALNEEAPGLHWRSAGGARPAEEGVRAMVSAWTPLGNAAIDARDVVKHYTTYMDHLGPALSSMGTSTGAPGSLFVTAGGEIRASLETVEHRYIRGPLGPVSILAHNHIIRCFASFFALRRALMRDSAKLPAAVIDRLKATGDPCTSALDGKKPKAPGGKITKLEKA